MKQIKVIKIDLMNGLAVPEGRIDSTLSNIIQLYEAGKEIPAIGQVELMDGIRVFVKHGAMKDIKFFYTATGVSVNVLPDGQVDCWPSGWLGEVHDQQLSAILE